MAGLGRVAFLGTGRFGVPLLSRLTSLADELLVVSQPDRPAGRGMRLRATPVAEFARSRRLTLVTPDRLASAEGRGALRAFAPDGLVLAAYGQIVPRDVLALAERPPLNVHPSLLPRHRGATPIPATILAGDTETGVTLIVMVPEVDAGPVVAQWRRSIGGREDAAELETDLAELAADAVPGVLARWAAGELRPEPQDERAATVTRVLRREDGRIDWAAPADAIDRQIRAFQPWPGAWTTLAGATLHIRRARPIPEASPGVTPGTVSGETVPAVACGEGALELHAVQPAGRPLMPAADWRRGLRGAGIVLGASVD